MYFGVSTLANSIQRKLFATKQRVVLYPFKCLEYKAPCSQLKLVHTRSSPRLTLRKSFQAEVG